MSPAPKSFLQKFGVDKNTVYLVSLLLAGGGEIQHAHSDANSAMQAQIAELNTAIALCQQSESLEEKKLVQIDHDLRDLTRSVDQHSLSGARAVAALP